MQILIRLIDSHNQIFVGNILPNLVFHGKKSGTDMYSIYRWV